MSTCTTGYHSAVMRARLIKANGNATNHVMITVASLGRVPGRHPHGRVAAHPHLRRGARQLVQVADQHRQRQIRSAKGEEGLPPTGRPISSTPVIPTVAGPLVGAIEKVTDQERCRKLFPFAGDARLAAGAPPADDVFKCALKPVDMADYKIAPTTERLAQLKQIFPDGVCDYSKPGVEQAPLAGTWVSFKGDGEFTALEPRP